MPTVLIPGRPFRAAPFNQRSVAGILGMIRMPGAMVDASETSTRSTSGCGSTMSRHALVGGQELAKEEPGYSS